MTPQPLSVGDIKVLPNERMPKDEWALIDVGSGSVTVVKEDGSQERLRGTRLARFKRWILRGPLSSPEGGPPGEPRDG